MDPNFFGAPRTGVHAYRVFDIAIVDLGLTLAAAYGWTRYTAFMDTDVVTYDTVATRQLLTPRLRLALRTQT
jgi:hypothetical protein